MSVVCTAIFESGKIFDGQADQLKEVFGLLMDLFKGLGNPDPRFPGIPIDFSVFLQMVDAFLRQFNGRVTCELGLSTAIELKRYQAYDRNRTYIENYKNIESTSSAAASDKITQYTQTYLKQRNIVAKEDVKLGSFYEQKMNESIELIQSRGCVEKFPFGLLTGLCEEAINAIATFLRENVIGIVNQIKNDLYAKQIETVFIRLIGLAHRLLSILDSMIRDLQRIVEILECVYLTGKVLLLTEKDFKEFQADIEAGNVEAEDIQRGLLDYEEYTELKSMANKIAELRNSIPAPIRPFSFIDDFIAEKMALFNQHVDAIKNMCQVHGSFKNVSPVIRETLEATGGDYGDIAPQTDLPSTEEDVSAEEKAAEEKAAEEKETVEEAARKDADKAAEEAAEEATRGTVGEDANEAARKAAVEAARKAARKSIGEVISAGEAAKEAARKAARKAAIEAARKAAGEAARKSVGEIVSVGEVMSAEGEVVSVGEIVSVGKDVEVTTPAEEAAGVVTEEDAGAFTYGTFREITEREEILSLDKLLDISYEDSKNSTMVKYNLAHIPILLYNLMKVFNELGQELDLSELITNSLTINLESLIQQIFRNNAGNENNDFTFRASLESMILPFLMNKEGLTIKQILNTHTALTMNILSDLVENYYDFGVKNLSDVLDFSFDPGTTDEIDLKNKLLSFVNIITQFNGLVVLGEDPVMDQLFIDNFGKSREELLYRIFECFTCNQSNIIHDKYRLKAINKLLNLLMNSNSSISSPLGVKFRYLSNYLDSKSSLMTVGTNLKNQISFYNDLKVYYTMDNTHGSLLADDAVVIDEMDSYNAILKGIPTQTTGQFGNCFEFVAASNQYIDCEFGISNSFGNNVSAISVSFWVKVNATNQDYGLFYIGDFASTQGEFAVNIYSDVIDLKLSNSTFTQIVPFTDTSSFHHVVAMYTGTDGILYVDNVKVVEENHTTNLNLTGLKTIIGAWYNTTKSIDGKIDNVKIFDRELTSDEIEILYEDDVDFSLIDNQTVVGEQSFKMIDTLKIVASDNYFGKYGNDIEVKVRLDDTKLITVIKEDIVAKSVVITIGLDTADETVISDAILDNNITLIDVEGAGIISTFGNYRLIYSVDEWPQPGCSIDINQMRNDSFLAYLLEHMIDSNCDLHPDTLTYVYPPEKLDLSYCLSGLEIRTPSLHKFWLNILDDTSAFRVINGVKYIARTPGINSNYIQIAIEDAGAVPTTVVVTGAGMFGDPYVITVTCDIDNVSQQNIRNAIVTDSVSGELVEGLDGSDQIGTAFVTNATSLIHGMDAIELTTHADWFELSEEQVLVTRIDKEGLLPILNSDQEKSLGIIDISTEKLFPISEEGFKIFIPEGTTGLSLSINVSDFNDVPTILGKYRYAPSRNDIETYDELIKSLDLTFDILRNRETFAKTGDDNGNIVIFHVKGLPLVGSGWLYIRPIDGSIRNIHVEVLYSPEFRFDPIVIDNEPMQNEMVIITYDWYGQYCYIFGGTNHDGTILNTIDKCNAQIPSHSSVLAELSVVRYGGVAVSDSENILLIGGRKDLGTLVSFELFKGGSEEAMPFIELDAEKYNLAAASDGVRYIMSGGLVSDSEIDIIEYGWFNAITKITDYGTLSSARSYHSGCSTEYAAFFSGGMKDTIINIFVHDKELSDLLSGFGFGCEEISAAKSIIESLYIALPTETISFADLINKRYNHTSACNGVKMLFAGGVGDSGILSSIERLQPNTESNSSEFSSLMTTKYSASSTHDYSNFITFGGMDDEGFTINEIEYTKFSAPSQSVEFGELNGTQKDLMTSSLG